MQRRKLFWNTSLIITLIFTILIYIGCEKKEPPKEETAKNEQQVDSVSTTATDTIKTVVAKIPDLTGKWVGTFDQRTTTLSITEQNGMEFKGKITINYREVINQEINGKLDTAQMKLTMKDLLHSRYAGTYTANLSKDKGKISGSFKSNLGDVNTKFSLNKK